MKFKKIVLITVFGLFSLGGAVASASACSSEPILGSVCELAFATTWCPEGFLLANGATYNVNQYQALFSLLRNRYGGNGTTSFGLPNFTDRMKRDQVTICIASQGIYPTRP
jgi:microcystin-dependent protein